jgi:hypothetical protein
MSESTTTPAVAGVLDAKPRKHKRIFMWFFLAVQAIFIAWLVSGIASVSHGACDPSLTANACTATKEIGGGIGAALVIGLWVAADVILGIGRLIVVFARRKG